VVTSCNYCLTWSWPQFYNLELMLRASNVILPNSLFHKLEGVSVSCNQ
jgi:hypothetical protein